MVPNNQAHLSLITYRWTNITLTLFVSIPGVIHAVYTVAIR
ncbi:MAG: YqaE/Pmp3 family membrane protein [Pseudomonadota bacterium]